MANYAAQLEAIADQIEGTEPTAAEEIRQIAWLMECGAMSEAEHRGI